MNDEQQPQQQDEQRQRSAVAKPSRWPGWIWSVPIAVLLIVAYLAFRQFAESGPTVHVTFPTGGDITAGSTKVKYQGVVVGEVESVRLQKDLREMVLGLSMHADMGGHLGKGTRFWITGRKPSFTDLSSLQTVISGPYIGVEPHAGPIQDHYEGLGEKPVNAYDQHVTHYVLMADKLGTVSRGTGVYYRNMQVGQVEDTKLVHNDRQFRIDLFINGPYDQLVHDNSRFWDAGAVQMSMTGPGPRLQLESVPSLLQGAIAFETPDGTKAGPPAKSGTTFTLYGSRNQAEFSPTSRGVTYRVVFHADQAGGLDSGAAVTLADKRIGSVTGTALQYDPDTGKLDEVATLSLDPDRITLAGGKPWGGDPRAEMDAMLSRLVTEGLRARLSSTIPMVGGKTVALGFVPNTTPAALEVSQGNGAPPEIPTAAPSSISGTMTALNNVATKLQAMPLDQIGESVNQAVHRIAGITSSPQLTDSLKSLDASLANLRQITDQAKTETGPLLESLRRTSREAQTAVAGLRGLLSNNELASTQPGTANLGDTLYQLSRAARSLRELADYLNQHPGSLLRGRSG